MLQQPMSLSSTVGGASSRTPTDLGGFGASLPTSIGMAPPQPMAGGLLSPLAATSNTVPSALPAAGDDKGPRVGLGQEEFRSAATWQNVINNPTSNTTTAAVREYGGKRRLASLRGKHLGLLGGGFWESLFRTLLHVLNYFLNCAAPAEQCTSTAAPAHMLMKICWAHLGKDSRMRYFK